VKPHLLKMMVESEHFCNAQPVHHDVGSAIGKRPPLVRIEAFKYGPCFGGNVFSYPDQFENPCLKHDVKLLLEFNGRLIPKIHQHQRVELIQYVAGDIQLTLACDFALECPRGFMASVIVICDCVPSTCVDK